jgi:hypothetical protein
MSLLVLLPQCGGGAGAGEAKSPSAEAKRSDTEPTAEQAPGDEDADDASATDTTPKSATCDDGTCSPCGSGICPTGWYCDEKASGGGACSWLTECADKPSCACVTRALGSTCKCREESGGLKVACD